MSLEIILEEGILGLNTEGHPIVVSKSKFYGFDKVFLLSTESETMIENKIIKFGDKVLFWNSRIREGEDNPYCNIQCPCCKRIQF